MSRKAGRGRWAAAFLGVFALLFAPATDERQGSAPETRDALGARILAPTGSEALEGTGSKLANSGFQLGKQRSWPDSVPLAVAPAVTALLLLWTSFACGFRSAKAPRLFPLRSLAPRGPPSIELA